MALPLQDIYYTDFHDFPDFQFSRHVCPKAGLCRLSVSTEAQSLQREDGRTACNVPRCNNSWCCALSLLCLVSPALQALSYLVNANVFMFSCFFCFHAFNIFWYVFVLFIHNHFVENSFPLWYSAIPEAFRFTFCKLFTFKTVHLLQFWNQANEKQVDTIVQARWLELSSIFRFSGSTLGVPLSIPFFQREDVILW